MILVTLKKFSLWTTGEALLLNDWQLFLINNHCDNSDLFILAIKTIKFVFFLL